MSNVAGAARADAPWDRLDALPRTLWLPAITTAAGRAPQRLADLEHWHAALGRGTLPDAAADFGVADAMAALRAACTELGLAALAAQADAFVEQLLRTLLWHLDRLIDLQPRLARADAVAQVAAEFRAAWQEEKGDRDTLLALLQSLGDLHALAWGELRGRLHSREWREAERVARHLATRPELAAVIRALGRAERQHDAAAPPPPAARDERPRAAMRLVETRLAGLPGEWRGIRLTGRIEQQLGSEAAMLRHPVLAKLWRARRAEERLLGYDSEAVLFDRRPDPHARAAAAPLDAPPETLERGPIVLCLDTSGSMRGAPETIAKAVALEAMRTAHRERRGCFLIAFGGPGEVLERELALTKDGLDALLELMGQGFDGGTDLQTPIEHAVARVHGARWHSADLLVVSDGEFGCTPATLELLDDARRTLGLRVQGVLVGDRETMGLMEVCDRIHWVHDWRRDAAGAATPRTAPPVHSKSLTALYFPNALSARAARHRPG